MTYPMRDMVIYDGALYTSHLRDLYRKRWWNPKPEEGSLHVFPVTSSACWHGYLTVFSAKLGEPFVPSWFLTFSPVADAPALTYNVHPAPVTLLPQAAPEEIDGCPIPDLCFWDKSGVRPAAYDLSPLAAQIHPWFWELGLILWKDRRKFLLELGEQDSYIGRVLSFREL